MGYSHISNLYKDQTILMFREVYALEKIHGTSAHVAFRDGQVHYSAGAAKQAALVAALPGDLKDAFERLGHTNVTVYGEAYGGSLLKQSHRYGQKQRFVAFDVRIVNPEGTAFWLSVPNAHDVCEKLGIEFVHYARVSTDLAVLDAERDAPSEQARRNGVEGDRFREGVVLRPLIELTRNDGERVIVKHKRDDERETASPRVVDDPDRLKVLDDAEAIAVEWVTPTRLQHVLDKLPTATTMADTPLVIAAMQEDVLREGAGELVDSRAARAAIGKATVRLFKAYVAEVEREKRSMEGPETTR